MNAVCGLIPITDEIHIGLHSTHNLLSTFAHRLQFSGYCICARMYVCAMPFIQFTQSWTWTVANSSHLLDGYHESTIRWSNFEIKVSKIKVTCTH